MKPNLIPEKYATSAIIAKEAGLEILTRLDLMTLEPERIIDVGCGIAEITKNLYARFPKAQIISVDSSLPMLAYAKHNNDAKNSICADAQYLPFANHSVDLIVANFFLSWQSNYLDFFREWRRVLRPDGVLLFNFLGIDSLKELRSILDTETIPSFVDMHDIGDILLQEKFADPVLDINYYTTRYKDKAHLIDELMTSGVWLPKTNTNIDLVVQSLPEQQFWEVTYEVINAHAFSTANLPESSDGITRIPLSQLRATLTQK